MKPYLPPPGTEGAGLTSEINKGGDGIVAHTVGMEDAVEDEFSRERGVGPEWYGHSCKAGLCVRLTSISGYWANQLRQNCVKVSAVRIVPSFQRRLNSGVGVL